jgi:hypothetical protein
MLPLAIALWRKRLRQSSAFYRECFPLGNRRRRYRHDSLESGHTQYANLKMSLRTGGTSGCYEFENRIPNNC